MRTHSRVNLRESCFERELVELTRENYERAIPRAVRSRSTWMKSCSLTVSPLKLATWNESARTPSIARAFVVALITAARQSPLESRLLAEQVLTRVGEGETLARGFLSAGAWDEPLVEGVFGSTTTTQKTTTAVMTTKQLTVAFHRAERELMAPAVSYSRKAAKVVLYATTGRYRLELPPETRPDKSIGRGKGSRTTCRKSK